jgi:hypothetical protein
MAVGELGVGQWDMRDFPGFEHIYLLHDPLSKRPMRGEIDQKIDTFAVTRGDAEVSAPVQVSWYMGGGMPSDFVWTGNVGALIVHRRVVQLMREQGFTGWRSYVVSVIGKGGDYHPEYEGLVILGRCNSADLSRSVVVLSEYPAGWLPHFLGYYFDEASWDGTDLFMETPDALGKTTAHVFVTERVRLAFEKAKVKNVRFGRLTERSVMTANYEIGSSHRLPRDFSLRVSAAYRRAGISPPKHQGG